MSDEQVRATRGSQIVIVISEHLQGKGKKGASPRRCQCGALWEVKFDKTGAPTVFKDGAEANDARLDWTGNNVAVECHSEVSE